MTRRVRQFCDIWFAAFPVWATLVFANVELYEDEGTFRDGILLVGGCLLMGTAFACCWVLNRTTRGLEGFIWRVIVLIPLPVGSTLCYFFKLRPQCTSGEENRGWGP